jgi:hypothetical protein
MRRTVRSTALTGIKAFCPERKRPSPHIRLIESSPHSSLERIRGYIRWIPPTITTQLTAPMRAMWAFRRATINTCVKTQRPLAHRLPTRRQNDRSFDCTPVRVQFDHLVLLDTIDPIILAPDGILLPPAMAGHIAPMTPMRLCYCATIDANGIVRRPSHWH